VELNWSTFVLEIINFLVLVWILKHFLFKPVRDVISRRRAGIEKTLADAEILQADAGKMQEQYEGRLADWDQERRQARDALAREFEAERTIKMTELQGSLQQERETARVAEARRQADAIRKIEETALMQGARFATNLLELASGPDTETRLVELLITELTRIPAARIAALRNTYGKTPEAIVVVSAFELPEDQRLQLKQALTTITRSNIPLRFEQNNELLAGVRIIIGAWVLGINLQDELKGFAELANDQNRTRHGNQPT